METLIIDTSSEYCLIALAQGDRLLSHTLYLHENRLSHSLLPDITALLQNTGHSLKQIDRIAVGVGPGSYTGTRVGVAVAKSLSYGLNIPLRGLCSLALFLPDAAGTFASVLPAKSGLFYLLTGEKRPQNLALRRAQLVSATELYDTLPTVDFTTARSREDLKPDFVLNKFLTFHPDPENLLYALQAPPAFSFEIDTQLIYLHAPT